jgi:hypothetical protein
MRKQKEKVKDINLESVMTLKSNIKLEELNQQLSGSMFIPKEIDTSIWDLLKSQLDQVNSEIIDKEIEEFKAKRTFLKF